MRDDAGRCGVACMRACPWAPCHAQITSFSKKPSFFGKSLKICGQGSPRACSSQGQGSPPYGHAAMPVYAADKARECSSQGHGSPPWARSQGTGMQQTRHGHAAAKAKAAPHGHAAAKARACSSQGHGSPHEHVAAKACRQGQGSPRGHAAKAKACCQG